MIKRGTWAAAVACAALFAAAGCGGSDSGGGGGGGGGAKADAGFKVPKVPMAQSVGAGEGKLNIIAWAGYAEDGSTDPKVDWVTPFEKQTGCQVNVKIGNTSDEMVTLMRTGQYDGVSASGDATLRLIAGGDVAPVNTNLVPNYADVFAAAQEPGLQLGRTARCTASRTAAGPTCSCGARTRCPARWTRGARSSTRARSTRASLTAYDNPIYIADAALYLKATKPDLKITNPYELDDKQFQASVDLLKSQRPNIGEYWSDYTKEQAAFTSGDSTVGTTWQVIANLLDADKVKVKTTLPKEGATGWSDTWMIASKAKHPNCMYKWMDWIISPKVNAEVAEWFGEAPSNAKSCAETAGQEPLQDLPRRRPGLLRQGLLLDDAAHAVRRRPRGGVQGLRGLGAGLDRDQGLRGHPEGATASPARAAAQRAAGLARRRLPGLARRPLHLGLLAARRLQRRDRQAADPRQLQAAVGERRLPDDRAAARSGSPRWSRSPTRCSPSRSPSSWPRSPAARVRGLLVVGILMPLWASLPGEGLRVARDPLRGRDPQLGAGAAGDQGAGLRLRRHLAGLQLPVAAVHDPAHLRRARAHPGLDARRLGRPRRQRPGRPSAAWCCRSPSRRSWPGRSSPSR